MNASSHSVSEPSLLRGLSEQQQVQLTELLDRYLQLLEEGKTPAREELIPTDSSLTPELRQALDLYLDKLLSMPLKEREIAVGTGRSDLIAAGILIYKQLFSILEFDRCVIIDDGLREGVAIELCMDDAHKL